MTSHNKRVYGSLRSPKPLQASYTRKPLYEMRAEAKIFGKSKSKSNKRGEI